MKEKVRYYFIDNEIYYQNKKQPVRKVELFDVTIDEVNKTARCFDSDGNEYILSLDEMIKEVYPLPYLDDEELNVSKMCIANIKDKMEAVETEINKEGKAYKTYLKEKLDSIYRDVKVLVSIVRDDEE